MGIWEGYSIKNKIQILLFPRSFRNSASMDKYRELMTMSKTKWLSDGQSDNKKNIQISLAFNLPLNNDMTLILIFNM